MKPTLQHHPNLAQCPLINQSFRIAPCTKLTSVSNFSVLLICFLCCFVLWIMVWSEFPVYKYCIKKSVKPHNDLLNIIFLIEYKKKCLGVENFRKKNYFNKIIRSLRNNKIVKMSLQNKCTWIHPYFLLDFCFCVVFFCCFLTIGFLVVHCIVSLLISLLVSLNCCLILSFSHNHAK